jgi:hypothetical protein
MGAERIPFKTFDVHIGSFTISPSYIQAVLILILIFLLVYSMAHLRHMYIHWSFKPAISWLFMGIVIAVIAEGFFMLFGRTLFTEVLGWKNAPAPIMVALDSGKSKLVDVLGVTNQVPSSNASKLYTAADIIKMYKDLSSSQAKTVNEAICK